MSLLLDALRQAAEAKRKQEAERQRTNPDATSPVEVDEDLSLELEADPAVLRAEALHLLERPSREHRIVDDALISDFHVPEPAVDNDRQLKLRQQAQHVFENKEPFRHERMRKVFLLAAAGVSLLSISVIAGYQFYSRIDSGLTLELSQSRELRRETSGRVADWDLPANPGVVATPAESMSGVETVAAAVDDGASSQTSTTVVKPITATQVAPPRHKQVKAVAAAAPASVVDISIERSNRQERLSAAIGEAYGAFQRNDLQAAALAYEQALALSPTNRDAWLGKAAIATRQHDVAAAVAAYQVLLRQNGADALALAGLSSLGVEQDPRQYETALRLALQTQPQNAALHFSLGSLYAREQRWAEAQSAYFQANQFDLGHPDYLYNLAVALEHLGQTATALTYYQQAMQAAGQRVAGFNVQDLQQRIQLLAAHQEATRGQ